MILMANLRTLEKILSTAKPKGKKKKTLSSSLSGKKTTVSILDYKFPAFFPQPVTQTFTVRVFQEEDHLFQRHPWRKTGQDTLPEADHYTDNFLFSLRKVYSCTAWYTDHQSYGATGHLKCGHVN